MAQRIVKIHICDLCKNEFDDSNLLINFQITGNTRTRGLDLCDDCQHTPPWTSVYDNAVEQQKINLQVTGSGSTKKYSGDTYITTNNTDSDTTCSVCTRSDFKTKQAKAQHESLAHGILGASALKMARRGHGDIPCPVQGCEHGCARSTGVLAHVRSAHSDQTDLYDAYRMALPSNAKNLPEFLETASDNVKLMITKFQNEVTKISNTDSNEVSAAYVVSFPPPQKPLSESKDFLRKNFTS